MEITINTPRIKKFLSSAKVGLTPETLWTGDEIGTTDSAKKHLLSLFSNGDKVFDTPKPEELIKQILEIATNEGDYVNEKKEEEIKLQNKKEKMEKRFKTEY